MPDGLVAEVTLQYLAGDDLLLEWTVTKDGAALDLTGMTIRFVAARTIGAAAVLSSEAVPATAVITINNQTTDTGKFRVAIDGDDTDGLSGRYRFEIEIEDAAAEKSTVARGFLLLLPNMI